MQIFGSSQVSETGRIDLAGGELSFNLIGKLAPGGVAGIGAFDIVGDVDISNSNIFRRSQIEIELGGVAQGEYDMISVEGMVSLMGSILVDLINRRRARHRGLLPSGNLVHRPPTVNTRPDRKIANAYSRLLTLLIHAAGSIPVS